MSAFNFDSTHNHLLLKGNIVNDITYYLKRKHLIGDYVKHLPNEKESSLYVSKFICDRKTNKKKLKFKDFKTIN